MFGPKIDGDPDQVTVAEYWPLSITDACGVAPRTGAVTTTFLVVMVVLAVAANTYSKTPAFTKFGEVGATPLIVKKFAVTPVSVQLVFGATVTVAV